MTEVRWLGSCAILALLLAGTGLAQENADPADEAPPSQDEEFVPEGGAAAPTPDDFEAIDDLLALDEEVLSDPSLYSYDPGARRDPFRSLEVRSSPVEREAEERPDGIPGLLIDELEVEGIYVLPEGPVAQVVSASQETSYLLSPGDNLWDGDVVRIGLDEVVFKQTIEDPTALKPFREVVKKLSSP